MDDLKQEKAHLRKQMLDLRAKIPHEERKKADQAMFSHMTSLPEYNMAQTIFVYVSVTNEPDTRMLIDTAWKHNKRVCVPRCESLGIMHALEIRSMEDLRAGKYNIPEPKDDCFIVPQDEIDLNIVPCVCCSVDGYRLGYGGGFYDRWLKRSKAPAALLCFRQMLVPTVPRNAHDQRINILVSDQPTSVIRFEENL